jgi:hypothetical protein
MNVLAADPARTSPMKWVSAGRWLIDRRARILTGIALAALVAGGVAALAGEGELADVIWGAATAVLAAELAVEVAHTIVFDRHMGVDTIALVAMVGALALDQQLAGIVVGLPPARGASSPR